MGIHCLVALLLVFLLSISKAYSAQISLAWDPNTEPDLAGYKLHYGHSSREYFYSVDVGNRTRHTLSGLEEDETYFFAVTAYDIYGDESDFSEELKPSTIALFQNYPNPFNAATNISFGVLKRSHVKITIYSILGQLVRKVTDGEYTLGVHRVQWDGMDSNHTPISSGVYIYRICTGTGYLARKMTVLR